MIIRLSSLKLGVFLGVSVITIRLLIFIVELEGVHALLYANILYKGQVSHTIVAI